MSVIDAFSTIKEWLNKCASLRALDSNFSYRVKYALNTAIDSGIPPMKFDTLKLKNSCYMTNYVPDYGQRLQR